MAETTPLPPDSAVVKRLHRAEEQIVGTMRALCDAISHRQPDFYLAAIRVFDDREAVEQWAEFLNVPLRTFSRWLTELQHLLRRHKAWPELWQSPKRGRRKGVKSFGTEHANRLFRPSAGANSSYQGEGANCEVADEADETEAREEQPIGQ